MSATLKVYQAFNRTVISELPVDSKQSLEKKLTTATLLFRDRKKWLPTFERKQILLKTAENIDSRRLEFAALIAKEGGKPLTDALVEVTRAIDGLRNAAEELRTFSGQEIPMGLTPASTNRMAFTTREPIGVVAAISAFNHPLNLIVHQVAPAIAVGCPVIVKPAHQTPLTCVEFVKALISSGLPQEWCQTIITDDIALSESLATDSRVRFLSFIGSAKVGWHLRSKIAPGTRCALEHGGAAPAIVDGSADLDKTVEAITKGGFYHAGQVCVSVQRVFVHKSISNLFIEKLSTRVQKLKVGDPMSKETEVGPLISPKEVDRVLEWIKEAEEAGANILGGLRISETTLQPTLILNPPETIKVSQLEIFGPVVCIYEYDNLDQALERANALPYSFQSSVFSSDIDIAIEAAKKLDASTVLINDHTAFRTDWMPFAGLKQSGYGVGGIPYTMKDMTTEKMIVLKTQLN